MKKSIVVLLSLSFLFSSELYSQSFLARISGIDIDLNRGQVSVKAPEIKAIPEMIKNLPKDVGQALLNPLSPILASAIRFSRGQALNRGTQPIPPHIKQKLSPYFPPNILNATWTTAGGITIDGALKNWFNQEGAVTLDDVVVFSDARLAQDTELWAHELTHVLQYSQLGVETFAFQYGVDWNSLESQARSNASRIMSSIQATEAGRPPSYSLITQIQRSAASNPIKWQDINNAAMQVIPATECIWINNMTNTTGNKCPRPITVTGLVLRRLMDGYTFTFPCNEPTCSFPAGAAGPLISPPGHLVVGVTAAY